MALPTTGPIGMDDVKAIMLVSTGVSISFGDIDFSAVSKDFNSLRGKNYMLGSPRTNAVGNFSLVNNYFFDNTNIPIFGLKTVNFQISGVHSFSFNDNISLVSTPDTAATLPYLQVVVMDSSNTIIFERKVTYTSSTSKNCGLVY